MMLDFEQLMIGDLDRVYPVVSQKGYLFHVIKLESGFFLCYLNLNCRQKLLEQLRKTSSYLTPQVMNNQF